MSEPTSIIPIQGTSLTVGVPQKVLLASEVDVFPHTGTKVSLPDGGMAALLAVKLCRLCDAVPQDFEGQAHAGVVDYASALSEIRKQIPDFDETSRVTIMTVALEVSNA